MRNHTSNTHFDCSGHNCEYSKPHSKESCTNFKKQPTLDEFEKISIRALKCSHSIISLFSLRSMASASKTTTTVSTASSSSTTLKSQYATGAASAASSYVDHLRPVQPSAAHTNVAMKGMGGARGGNSMEMTTTNRGYYRQGEESKRYYTAVSSFYTVCRRVRV